MTVYSPSSPHNVRDLRGRGHPRPTQAHRRNAHGLITVSGS